MKDIIRRAGERAAVAGLKAAEKAAPAAAAIAMKTGQAAFKAGAAAANAGSVAVAVASHRKKREEKEQQLIDNLKRKYPGCYILFSEFDPNAADIGGHKSTIHPVTAYAMHDEYFAPQYSAEGIVNLEFGPRHLHVYDNNHRKIGSCFEHGVINSYISIESGRTKIMNVERRSGVYEFSDPRYESIREKDSKSMVVGRSGQVLMEIHRIKSYEVIAIVDPSRTSACMILYVAMKFTRMPRPTTG